MEAPADDGAAPAFRSKVSVQGSVNEAPDVEDEDEEKKPLWSLLTENPNTIATLLIVVFLVLLSAYAAEAQGDKATYAMGDQIKGLFEDFEDVRNVEEWWSYMRGPFINKTYPQIWYNGDVRLQEEDRYVGEEFKILGVIQLRQVRVRKDACTVPARVQGIVSECVATYAAARQDVAQYGPDIGDGRKQFQFLTSGELGFNDRIRLGSGVVYDGGGYVTALPTTEDSALPAAVLALTQLFDALWLDRQTSAVFVHFNLYHPTLHRVGLVQLAWEERPGFRGEASLEATVVPLQHLYASEGPVGFLVLEALVLTAVVVSALNELFQGTFAYWFQFWTLYDWTTYIIFFCAFAERYGAFLSAASRTFPPEPSEFVSYRAPALQVWRWKNLLALANVLSWMRLLRVCTHLRFMHHLFAAIYNALQDLLAVVACTLVVCFGFALSFFLAFGDASPVHATLAGSMRALFALLRGEVPFEQLLRLNDYLGPVLLVAYVLITTLLLVNLLVAVVVSWLSSIISIEDPVSVAEELRQRLSHPRIKAAISQATKMVEALKPWGKASKEEEQDSVQQIMQDHGQEPPGDAKHAANFKSVAGKPTKTAFGAMELKSMAPARMAHTEAAGAISGEVNAAVQEQGETLRKIERKLEHDMDLTLQCVLQLSKEVRALSHRVKTLTDTAETAR